MANIYWKGTDGNYSTGANFSGAATPTTGDNVRLIAEYTGNITTGLDQSADAIGDFIVESGYTGSIASVAAYLQIDPNRFEFSGEGVSYIDIGSAAIAAVVNKTINPQTGGRGLYLKGSAITTLAVQSGAVGLATVHGDTATAASVRTIGTKADLWCGAGCTLTTADCLGGMMRLRASVTTLNVWGGTVYLEEAAAATTVNIYGGTVFHNSTGTVATWNAFAGTSDWLAFSGSRTVTSLNIYRNAVIRLNKAAVTHTNAPALSDSTMQLTAQPFGG